MPAGADAIVQGALEDGNWYGRPDVLLRIDAASALGAWAYEVADTKLARETRGGTILQLGLYCEMLARVQGRRPDRFYIVTPDTAAPVADLARLPLPLPFKPKRGAADTYVRVREQARVQVESRGKTPPLYELRSFEDGEGLSRLPEPSPGDVFLDLEGDLFAAEGGREYLFGVVTVDSSGKPAYRSF